MKIVAVFHGMPKVSVIGPLWPAEIAANPPLALEGMININWLVKSVTSLLPFDGLYSSRMARALDTASIFALAFNLNIQTVDGLGQHGNKEGEMVVCYPGYEGEGPSQWLKGGLEAIHNIYNFHINFPAKEKRVLIVSHRPIIGALVAYCRRTTDDESIMKIVNDSCLMGMGFRVFETEPIGKDGIFKLNLIG